MKTSKNQYVDLLDIGKNGKDRKWKERKMQSLNLSKQLEECWFDEMQALGYPKEDLEHFLHDEDICLPQQWIKKSGKTNGCAEVLTFQETKEGKLKLFQAWFCKDRLCPMCNWRRALKFAYEIGQILQVMKDRKTKGRPIFLTLTMKNVSGDEIGDSFSKFAVSFNKMMKYKKVAKVNIGAIRTSEITYNAERDDYNVHIHCLVWMTPTYFTGGSYISQNEWTSLWQKATKLDYTPVVNVKAVKPKTPTEFDPTGLYTAVLEVSKYPIKPEAFVSLTTVPVGETMEEKSKRLGRIKFLETGMRSKRLISFFGIFKEIRKELGQTDDDEDLVGADGENPEENSEVVVAIWNREHRNYFTHREKFSPKK